jgi:hypothetical protein
MHIRNILYALVVSLVLTLLLFMTLSSQPQMTRADSGELFVS